MRPNTVKRYAAPTAWSATSTQSYRRRPRRLVPRAVTQLLTAYPIRLDEAQQALIAQPTGA
ncbi:hypothetical protein [Streptomyces sp. NBC_01304]|uniref:hypothetical protein n=1 Tax=Streptomyces sp. NBC_01304 TaxID=2903818 RepID=UPI002E1367A3|nr:hypothetical protein OG430_40545 [Streptomyces sp. NBC_01304]